MHLAQDLGNGRLALLRLAEALGQHLDAEADVALLVAGDVVHALAEPGHRAGLVEEVLDEVLPGLGEGRLDDHVVEGDGLRELGERAVVAELLAHPVEAVEDVPVSPARAGPRCRRASSRSTSPAPITSLKKRWKNTEWRASSTCCVARKYFCSSFGAASM